MYLFATALSLVFILTPPGSLRGQQIQRFQPMSSPDEPQGEPKHFLKFSGEYETILDYRKDFSLDDGTKDDILRLDTELQLRTLYRHNRWTSTFLEAKMIGMYELYVEDNGRHPETVLERGESWVRFESLFGHNWVLQIGRQNFEEPRKWWWDDDLDAIRVKFDHGPWSFESGVAEQFFTTTTQNDFNDPEEDNVLRVLARGDWRFSKDHTLSLYYLYQHDGSADPPTGSIVNQQREDPSDATLWWGGFRGMGRVPAGRYGEMVYWADLAMVWGDETVSEFTSAPGGNSTVTSKKDQRVHGWAIDLGGRWVTQLLWQPRFTVAYALGSGDGTPESGTDRSYRQTGLQSNDEQFRTYGELLRPELSNLAVGALSVEFPIFSESRMEFAYRRFRQQKAAPFLRDGRIEAQPNGFSKDVGQEWMFLLGIEEWEGWQLEWVGAVFRAGNAYGNLSGETAMSLFMKVTHEFDLFRHDFD